MPPPARRPAANLFSQRSVLLLQQHQHQHQHCFRYLILFSTILTHCVCHMSSSASGFLSDVRVWNHLQVWSASKYVISAISGLDKEATTHVSHTVESLLNASRYETSFASIADFAIASDHIWSNYNRVKMAYASSSPAERRPDHNSRTLNPFPIESGGLLLLANAARGTTHPPLNAIDSRAHPLRMTRGPERGKSDDEE